MAQTPKALKKAAGEDKEAAEDAEDTGSEKEEEKSKGEKAPREVKSKGEKGKKRQAYLAKLRQDSTKRVREAREQEKRKLEDVDAYLDRRIMVSNLPEKTTCEDLRKLFEKFGTVHSARHFVNSRGQFRGEAYVTFEGTKEVQQALQANGTEYKGQTLGVEKTQRTPAVFGVFVGGLPHAAEEQEIRQHFQSCGGIKAVCSMNPDREKRKQFDGTAFIRFKAAAGTEAALKLHGSMFAGRMVTVTLELPPKKVKASQTRSARAARRLRAGKSKQQPAKAEGESKKDTKRNEFKPGKAGSEALEAKGEKQKAEKLAPSATGGEAAEAKGEKRQAIEIAAEEPGPQKKKSKLERTGKKAQA